MALPEYSHLLSKLFPAVLHLTSRAVSDPEEARQVAHEILLQGHHDYPRYRDGSLDAYREHHFELCRERCRRYTRDAPPADGTSWDDARLFVSLCEERYRYEEIAEILGKSVRWAFATARRLSRQSRSPAAVTRSSESRVPPSCGGLSS